MKDEIKKETTANPEQDDTKADLSRREFVSRSTGTLAAASAMAAGAGASLLSKEASAAWPSARLNAGGRRRSRASLESTAG